MTKNKPQNPRFSEPFLALKKALLGGDSKKSLHDQKRKEYATMMGYENMVDLVVYDIWSAKMDGEFILDPLEDAMEYAHNRFSAILGDSTIEQIAEDAAELYKERFCSNSDDEISQTISDAIKMRF